MSSDACLSPKLLNEPIFSSEHWFGVWEQSISALFYSDSETNLCSEIVLIGSK